MKISSGLVRRAAALSVTVLAAIVLISCSEQGDPTSPGPDGGELSVDRIEVTPGGDTLTALGEARSYDAVALTADDQTVSGVEFTWSSSEEQVATVDGEGVVEALANGSAEITASAQGVSGSAGVAVIQQVAAVEVSPSTATLSTVDATEQFSATATDENGNAVTDVEVVWQSEDHTVATVDPAGSVTSKGDGEATITATAQDVPGHATLTVNQAIDHLAFRTGPTDATAGRAVDPAVQIEVRDADGNVVQDADLDVTLAIGTNPAGGSLGGAKTVNAVNGVATFSNAWIDAAATGYTLEARGGGTGPVTSRTFAIDAADAAKLAYRTEPGDAAAGDAIAPAIEVEVQDPFGNLVPSSSADVRVALDDNPGGTSVKGTTTATAASGVAIFDDLNVEVAEAGYSLEVRGNGLHEETSGSFDVSPAAESQLAFVTDPTDAEGQEAIEPAVEVEVRDAFGNPVSSSSTEVTVALSADPTGGDAILSGTTAATTANGVAAFGDLSVARPGENFTLEASATGLDTGESGTFAIELTFVQTSVGGHSCAVTVADRAYCWGTNNRGVLGDGSGESSATPVPVAGGHEFVQVTAGNAHTCALTPDDDIYCWGFNSYGQLGDGTTQDRPTPAPVNTSESFVQVTTGTRMGCGLTTSDELYCWGWNTYGQLGDGTTTDRPSPVPVDTNEQFAQVNAGGGHVCAVSTADAPYCWGLNNSGQVGDGTTTDRSTPVPVDTAEPFAQVSAGNRHTCGVVTVFDDPREPYCWGNNVDGALGDGTTADSAVPVAVSVGIGDRYEAVSSGYQYTCGVTPDDEAFCWGDNDHGQLGDGSIQNATTPHLVSTTALLTEVDAGFSHSCGVTAAGDGFCWGDNDHGQLGDGTTARSAIPVPVTQ